MTDEERKEWWCPKCRDEIDGSHVTFDEVHEVCGYRVLDYNPDAELKRLRDEIENLRERVTVGRRMDSETIDAKDRTISRLVDQNNAIQQVDENAALRARIEDVEQLRALMILAWEGRMSFLDAARAVSAWLKEGWGR